MYVCVRMCMYASVSFSCDVCMCWPHIHISYMCESMCVRVYALWAYMGVLCCEMAEHFFCTCFCFCRCLLWTNMKRTSRNLECCETTMLGALCLPACVRVCVRACVCVYLFILSISEQNPNKEEVMDDTLLWSDNQIEQ